MKLTLNNGRSVEINSCPIDQRGDELSVKLSALDYDKPFSDLRKQYRDIALEAISLWNSNLKPEDVLSGLDIAKCVEIIRILWGRPASG